VTDPENPTLIGGETHYGWVFIQTFPPVVGGRILEWAYESEPGVGIMAGAVPEPSAGLLILLATGATLLRRRRAHPGILEGK